MTNTELIFKAVCRHLGIDEETGAEMMFAGTFPVYHTYEGWKEIGQQVQKGEKAQFSAKIWKMTVKKDEDGKPQNKLIMKSAYFFSRQQVKPIEA